MRKTHWTRNSGPPRNKDFTKRGEPQVVVFKCELIDNQWQKTDETFILKTARPAGVVRFWYRRGVPCASANTEELDFDQARLNGFCAADLRMGWVCIEAAGKCPWHDGQLWKPTGGVI